MKSLRPPFVSLSVVGAFLSCALCAALFRPAAATPYWGPEEVAKYYHPESQAASGAAPLRSGGGPASRLPAGPGTGVPLSGPPIPYLTMLAHTAHFIDSLQVTTPGPDFGGIREGENLWNIIQTDNTSESIWVWSRYYEITGDNRYHQNILNSFTYEMNHPAYLEEGDSTAATGYYRMYNCGWAVRAEEKYRDVYHDATYQQYGDSCGSYIAHHTLTRPPGDQFDSYVNPPVLSWALGNLYHAGEHEGNGSWIASAVRQSRDRVKVWVQQEPTLMGNETWAMSGGATMWGMVNSYLLGVPDSTVSWLNRYKGYLDTYANAGANQNAWNGWYAYGHRAVGLALNDPIQLALHVTLTDTLMTFDGDHDGGIPAYPAAGNGADQSWVSSYLYVFGLSELITGLAEVEWENPSAPLLRLDVAPNPFHSRTRLSLRLTRPADLDLSVFDVSGREVTRLAHALWPAGTHAISWDGRKADGGRASSGVYWMVAQTPAVRVSQKVVLAP